ncbi:MAG: cation:proton antiporter [Thermoplasmata archaeon]|nr:cation:proton antiporter [Thermoplasmata archaeon]MCI4358811.1 cation:proton antiporter [Thermoplasmata archaeon]
MLDATTQLIVDLFVLLAAAVLAGEISVHLGQAALVGQLIAGVVLGPTLLGPFFGLTGLTAALTAVQTLAVIFVLFLAGLEVVPTTIYRMEFGNLVLGIGAFAVPFTLGALLVGPVLGLGYPTNLYVALTLSITALPVMSIMLDELGLGRTRLGTWLLNAALVNELTAVSVFAVLLRLGTTPFANVTAVLTGVVSLALFIATMLTIHQGLNLLRSSRLWDRLAKGFAKTWRSKQGEFALLMVLVVGATLYSQFLGLTYVVGAFYAGLLVTRESAGKEAHRSISQIFGAMSWGFFIPLFFALIGVNMNLQQLATPTLVVSFAILLGFAAISKIGSGFSIATLFGWKRTDALTIGHLVNSRGAVELAMAVILLDAGLITIRIFTLVAAIGLVTTILAPIGATQAILRDPERRDALYRRVPSLRPGPGRRRYRSVDPEEALWGWSPGSILVEDTRASASGVPNPSAGSTPPPQPTPDPASGSAESAAPAGLPPLPRDRRKPRPGK